MRASALLRLSLAVLLAATAAQAGLIATDTYSCDPATCRPPACLCASNAPPGGLSPDQIPQFVLLSHDNALNTPTFDLMMEVLGSKVQRNGCPVPITWFAMRYHSQCEAGRTARLRGDEVAMQANRFYPTNPFTATDPAANYDSRDPVTGKPSVEIEITMSRKWWNEVCNLPMRDMVGFRAQGYYNNPPVRQALSKNGYLYDATLVERWYPNSPTSPSANETLWPYSMDAGIPQECDFMGETVGKCAAGEAYRGLWESPLYQLQDEAGSMYGVSNYGDTTDGRPAVPDLVALLKSQLGARLAGGRTPMQISTFYEWLSTKPVPAPADDPKCIFCKRAPSANALALARFIDYAVSLPDVWFITHSDLIAWMQNPVPKDQFAAWAGWACKTPGVKADLSAVNLTAADLAAGPRLAMPAPPSPDLQPASPPAVPAEATPPAPAPAAAPAAGPKQAPVVPDASPPAAAIDSVTPVLLSPAGSSGAPPASGSQRASFAASGAAAFLGALLLAL